MPITWNDDAQPVTRGGTTFLQTNRGEKKIRVWQPSAGQWNLTALGRRFYRDRPSEYIISIPVRYDIIRNRDGAEVRYKGYMPVTQLSARLRGLIGELTAEGGDDNNLLERLRTGILSEVIRWRDEEGNIAIHYESDVTTFYDPGTPRGWKYSEMRTTIEADGGVEQQAFLDQPMRAARPSALIHADGVIEEAFHELPHGVNCAIYQLSKHRGVDYDQVEAEMQNIHKQVFDE